MSETNADMASAQGKPTRDPAAWREDRRKRLEVALASMAATCLMRVIGPTLRLEAVSYEQTVGENRGGTGMIFAMWHGTHFPVLWAYRKLGIYCMTSHSPDGEILTRIMQSLGYCCVRGSSTRGGKRGLIELARLVRSGRHAAIAVDGPKGPRYTVKPGVMTLAKLTGAPILPVAGGLARYKQFRSWDRYRLAWPFSCASVLTGELVYVESSDGDEVVEAKRQTLEKSLRSLQETADRRTGNSSSLELPDTESAAR